MSKLDRSEAVRLARYWQQQPGRITDAGITTLAKAVLAMDAELALLYQERDMARAMHDGDRDE